MSILSRKTVLGLVFLAGIAAYGLTRHPAERAYTGSEQAGTGNDFAQYQSNGFTVSYPADWVESGGGNYFSDPSVKVNPSYLTIDEQPFSTTESVRLFTQQPNSCAGPQMKDTVTVDRVKALRITCSFGNGTSGQSVFIPVGEGTVVLSTFALPYADPILESFRFTK